MNWLARKRISIVDPTAGVTRDRVTYLMQAGERYFELVDTGGIGIVDSDDLSADIERQIQAGLEQADLILFVVDAQAGVVPLDHEVARRLRPLGKRVLLVVNKTPPSFDPDQVRARVAQAYNCEVAAVLPHSDEMMILASSGIFVLRYPDHPLTVLYREVAARLVA
jgi:small GTP-binding protein